MNRTLTDLISYSQAHDRVCPLPQRWNELYQMLPPDRQQVGLGSEPPLPLILAAWNTTPILLKILRLRQHLEYAEQKGVLAEVDHFLRSLRESEWAHRSDFARRPR